MRRLPVPAFLFFLLAQQVCAQTPTEVMDMDAAIKQQVNELHMQRLPARDFPTIELIKASPEVLDPQQFLEREPYSLQPHNQLRACFIVQGGEDQISQVCE